MSASRHLLRWMFGTAAIAAFLLLIHPAEAQQNKRVALVIGNSSYAESPLKNPVNDARAMAAALRSRGFEVIARENATKNQMESAVADFGEKLTEGATGLFFFAGHGMQVQGRNFLIPVDARITSEQRVRLETLDVDIVLDQMQAARAKVSMVILDACRNNPFERRFRSAGGGLAQINAPEGTLLAYATAPGKVAADGDGANGLYTQEFLKALAAPGLKVEDVFKQVRVNVSRASNGMQVPWEASSLTGDFYFTAGAPAAAAAPAAAPPSQQTLDFAFWEAVKSTSNPAELQAYLETFPSGTFAPLARARMAGLNRAAPTASPAPPPTPAATAPPPARVEPPKPAAQQQAALTPPAAVLPAGAFDGRYLTTIHGARGKIDLQIEVTGTRIVGFGAGPSVICRIAGTVDASGAIQRLIMECPNSNVSFTGRVTPGEAGATFDTEVIGSHISRSTISWKKAGAS